MNAVSNTKFGPSQDCIDYIQRRRKETITLVVVGILILTAAAIALYFTWQAPKAFQIGFGVAAGIGGVVLFSPLGLHDWTSYDSQDFAQKTRADFREYNDDENEAFVEFINRYSKKKMTRLGDFGFALKGSKGEVNKYLECKKQIQGRRLHDHDELAQVNSARNTWNLHYRTLPKEGSGSTSAFTPPSNLNDSMIQ